MKLWVGLFCVNFLIMSCSLSDSHDSLFECEENCDSISVLKKNGKVIAYTSFYNGAAMGKFVLLQNSDTIFGYKEFIDIYWKSTFKYSESTRVVKLLSSFDGEMQIREFFQFEDERLWETASHFIDFNISKDSSFRADFHVGDYDTVFVFAKNEQLLAKKSYGNSVSIPKNVVNLMNPRDIIVFRFSKFKMYSDGAYDDTYFEIPISRGRIMEQKKIIQPSDNVP